jgi:hypothetical protein
MVQYFDCRESIRIRGILLALVTCFKFPFDNSERQQSLSIVVHIVKLDALNTNGAGRILTARDVRTARLTDTQKECKATIIRQTKRYMHRGFFP